MPSDSFADLWNSSAPPGSTSKPQTLASQSSASLSKDGSRPGSRLDTFSLLAATTTSGPSSRSITPSLSTTASSSTVKRVPSSQGGSSDAFSSLLGSSFASASSRKEATSLSLADRQARSLQEQHSQMSTSKSKGAAGVGVWDGLDMLGSAGPASSKQTTGAVEDEWAFGLGAAKPTSSKPSASATINEPRPMKASSSEADLFDFLSGSAAPPIKKTPNPSPPPLTRNESPTFDPFERFASPQERQIQDDIQTSNDPGDFDFGDREYREGGDEDDEVLGILGSNGRHVAESLPDEFTQRSSHRRSPLPRSKSTASPPPHILGQIVEMGFSPQQARVALAATDTGLDVQQALEMLLSNGAGVSSHSSSPVPSTEASEPRQRARPRPSRHDSSSNSNQQHQAAASGGGDLQEKADKLLAQASEIGFSVFTRAGALWKEGKARAQKVYEEQIVSGTTSAVGSGRSTPITAGRRGGEQQQQAAASSGRPKWMMTEGEFKDDEEHNANARHTGGFRDDDDESGPSPSEPPLPRRPQQQAPPARPKETVNLFGGDEPTTYISPARRRGAKSNNTPPASSTPAPPRQQQKPQPQQTRPPRPPTPLSIRLRPAVGASPSALSSSATHKAKGTEFFKLGRYAEAVSSYTSALSSLPEGHLQRIPLLNNRALARIRTGDHVGANEDCGAVLEILGADYYLSKDIGAASGSAEDIDFKDAWVKALRRRAEACEGRERWTDAQRDWEALAGCTQVGTRIRNEALAGVGRCKKGVAAIAAGGVASSASIAPSSTSITADFDILASPSSSIPASSSVVVEVVKLKPKPKPIALSRAAEATIASAVRAAQAASQAEEDEIAAKHELKDRVDARLAAWKGGKEGNLRALLASLDGDANNGGVLWPELGWTKVGMHELVTEKQLKVRYTRAIAKVHPDKLNANNTTLEQRMIANGVFGTLNEAWAAHKG